MIKNIKQEDIIAILATWLKVEKERREELEKKLKSATTSNDLLRKDFYDMRENAIKEKRKKEELEFNLIEKDAHIKKIEEVSESYRRLYSELEGAILDTATTRTGFVPTENPTNSFLLMTIKSEIIDYNELEKEVDKLRNECIDIGKKYKRLTAMINRHPNQKAKLVLNSHREQEKKK